jgi:hypothetical protein
MYAVISGADIILSNISATSANVIEVHTLTIPSLAKSRVPANIHIT